MANSPAPAGHDAPAEQRVLAVLLYSDDVDTRAEVRLAVGRRPAADLPVVEWTECATAPAVLAAVDSGGLDVLVLDGESAPAGGLGLCKQLKDEISPPPGSGADRPAAGCLAGHLVPRGRCGAAPTRPGGSRRGPGHPRPPPAGLTGDR